MSEAAPLKVEVWSDVVCPFCWIGKRHLEAGIREAGLEGQVEVVFRAFELNPELRRSIPIRDYLASKFGSAAHARRMTQHVEAMGAPAGLLFNFDEAIAARTFDAHRVIRLAHDRGVGLAVTDRLMRAHFQEGADVGDPGTLRRLAAEAGLDDEAVASVLASDAYTDRVREDQAMAHAIGVRGVPFTVIDGKYAVSGAQPAEVFARALAVAREELAPKVADGADGPACADDACEVPGAKRE